MNAKHVSKNAMSHKLVFLAVGIAIAISAAFSICATSQAKAETNETNGSLIVTYDLDLDNLGFEIDELRGNSFTTAPEEIWKEFFWKKGDDCLDLWPNKNHMKKVKCYSNIKIHTSSSVFEITLGVEDEEDPEAYSDYLYFRITCNNIDHLDKNADLVEWYINGRLVPHYGTEKIIYIDLTKNNIITCSDKKQSPLYNISGQVKDAETCMPVPFANVAYWQYNPWWDMYVPVEGVEPVQTDMWGFYTLGGITEEMLPGKVFVYDNLEQIGESAPILMFPKDTETLNMWPIIINEQEPDPPEPPIPPDPPVPPGPVPPEPNPPEPVPPVPTPVDPGGGIAQTGDDTGYAFAAFAMLAVCAALSCGMTFRKEDF